MKYILSTLTIILICFGTASCQEGEEFGLRKKTYKIWVKTNNKKIKGFLYAVNKEGITISETLKIDPKSLVFYPCENIEYIKARRKGVVAKASLIGGVAGALVGYAAGVSEGDDDPGWFSSSKEAKGNLAAATLAVPGGMIGGLIGSSKKKIELDYKKENYINQLATIAQYTLPTSK